MIDKAYYIEAYMKFGAWVEMNCEKAPGIDNYFNKNINDREFVRLVTLYKNSLYKPFIHKQNRPDVLPGWEYWGVTPSGKRIYRATEQEVLNEIMKEIYNG